MSLEYKLQLWSNCQDYTVRSLFYFKVSNTIGNDAMELDGEICGILRYDLRLQLLPQNLWI